MRKTSKAPCLICGRVVRFSAMKGAIPWAATHRAGKTRCPGSLMAILPPAKLPDGPVIQELPLDTLKVGLYSGDLLVGVEEFRDPRAEFCRQFNEHSELLHRDLVARPIATEGGAQ
jgi:hypothetical protein